LKVQILAVVKQVWLSKFTYWWFLLLAGNDWPTEIEAGVVETAASME
jgi:hypothetical protein